METRTYDQLTVHIATGATELGGHAAEQFAKAVNQELAENDETTVILALGAAEESLFAALKARQDIPWERINVLHVDVYMGISDLDPRSGGARLRHRLLDQLKPKQFYPMIGDTQPVEKELERYTQLYQELRPSVCVVGIGETGHLAFIDPPADFSTNSIMVAVALAEQTRHQIAAAGIFDTLEEVPRYGLSLTIPALVAPKTVIALADEPEKAPAIKKLCTEPVSIMCPASILRNKPGALLYLSQAAAADLL